MEIIAITAIIILIAIIIGLIADRCTDDDYEPDEHEDNF